MYASLPDSWDLRPYMLPWLALNALMGSGSAARLQSVEFFFVCPAGLMAVRQLLRYFQLAIVTWGWYNLNLAAALGILRAGWQIGEST